MTTDLELLRMALIGFEKQRADIEERITDVQRQLGNRRSAPPTQDGAQPRNGNHQISAEGRARIAAAQRKRWAAAKKAGTGRNTKPPAPAKRKLSAAAAAKLIENLKKARAAKAAKRVA